MPDLDRVYMDLVRADYTAYCYHSHRGFWKVTRLGEFLTKTVQEFVERKSNKAYEILALSVSPQHGKSMSITETFPSYYLGKYPDNRVIEISYAEDFATLFGRKNKAKITEFGDIFNVSLSKNTSSNTEFEIEGHRGGMISRGVLSGVTGRPADLMIIDDPIKTSEEAESPKYRDKLKQEWLYSYKTRLSAGAKVIVIQTRWHEDDLIGFLLKTEPNITYINIPCEAEENDPLGRKVGEPLAPEIGKDAKWLEEFKLSYAHDEGTRAWEALYQGHPSIKGGNIIQSEWWQYYEELPEDMVEVVLSVDCAFKDKIDSDFVALQVWGKVGRRIYLVHAIKKHLDFPKTVESIKMLLEMFPEISRTYIEDKANGSAVIAVLKKDIPGIIPVEPKGGKVARANAVSGAIETGFVYLPKHAGFTKDFVEEFSRFPFGAHDDQVDAATQALTKLIFKSGVKKKRRITDEEYTLLGQKKKKVTVGKGEKINVV